MLGLSKLAGIGTGVTYKHQLLAWMHNKKIEKQKLQPELVSHDEVPVMKRELAILSGYRPIPTAPIGCALSVFTPCNEMVNFWTHFLPAVFFSYKFMKCLSQSELVEDRYCWPYLVYLFTCICYPLMSSLAHTFGDVSWWSQHIWYFLDYVGLALYAYGSGLAYRAYAFPEELLDTWYASIYLSACMLIVVVCTALTCRSRFHRNSHTKQSMRLTCFAMPYIWDHLPLVYRLAFSDDKSLLISGSYHAMQFTLVILASFFYASHLPEKLAPGKFDVFGHSHNLLHILGIFGTMHQMEGIWQDLLSRRELMLSQNLSVLYDWCLLTVPITALLNLFVLFYFLKHIDDFVANTVKSKAL